MKNRLIYFFLLISWTYGFAAYYVPQDEIQKIRNFPEVIEKNYKIHCDELKKQLGKDFNHLSDDEYYFIHCALVAHCMAPYGWSNAVQLDDMLQAPLLNCGNYTILAVRLAEAGRPEIQEKVHLPVVGWESLKMGNHAALFILRSDKKDIFIDPTNGIIARASYDEIAGGKPVAADQIKDFCFWDRNKNHKNVVLRIINYGLLKPSELLYYFYSVDLLFRCLPLSEFSATPATQIQLFGPQDYLKKKLRN